AGSWYASELWQFEHIGALSPARHIRRGRRSPCRGDRFAVRQRGVVSRSVRGLFPWLAGPKPCSLMDYLWSDLQFLCVLGFLYWPLILAWCLFGPLVGYVLDRRSARSPSGAGRTRARSSTDSRPDVEL